MVKRSVILVCVGCAVLFLFYALFSVPLVPHAAIPTDDGSVKRGEYLVHAGGCISCHQGEASKALSGGTALQSDFGIFYAPNITPDVDTGIGSWDAKDFFLALKHGRTPAGNFYYPAFPYRAYAGMSDEDVLDLAAYLMTRDPVHHEVPEHILPMWLKRWQLSAWNVLADLYSDEAPLDAADAEVLRGAYLVRNLGHCGECHTPRNTIGIPILSQEFSGATMGESHADAIDPLALEKWSKGDISFFLLLGMKPDGEFVGGEMESVIEHNTAMLTDADRSALAAFLKRSR